MNILDVLVVGAGPVGLFCANELTRQGLRCRIIDKKAEISDKSKALAIHIRSLEVFKDCDFLDTILEQGLKVEGIILKSQGEELINTSFADVQANYHFLIDLPQSKTEQILYDGLINKGLEVEWQTELTEIDQTSNNVIATLQKVDGSKEKLHTSWLMACDGSHSTLRRLLYAKFTGSSYEQTFWLADLTIDWALPPNKGIIYLTKQGPLACLPLGEKQYRLVMTAQDNKEPTMEEITQLFKLRSSDAGNLRDPIWISQFGIDNRQIEKYRYNRVFFAGDAAHVHSPIGGQGLNTGLQDVYNLGWKLALVHKGFAKEQLLDSYQSERYRIAKSVLKKTGIMTRLITLSNPFLIGLRNKLMQFAMSLDPIKNFLLKNLAELDISYADSPIVKALGAKTAFKLGEFLTDFSLMEPERKEEKRLQQITQGTLHHLFLFAGLSNNQFRFLDDIASTIEQEYQGLIKTHIVHASSRLETFHSASMWIDPAQAVHKYFDIQRPTAILIRPDKYIGLTQCPINQEELLRYLEKSYINKSIH